MSLFPPQRLLVPFDFSAKASQAAEMALEMVTANEHIHVAHVLPDIVPDYPYGTWMVVEEQERLRVAREALEQQFAAPRFAGLHLELLFGEPGQALAEYAETMGADLILISSHGGTGLRRWLLGSVTERVVRLAHCPVLVLRD